MTHVARIIRRLMDRLTEMLRRQPDLQEEFATRLCERIRGARPDLRFTYDAGEFLLRMPAEDGRHVMFLRNAFLEYAGSDDEQVREAILTRWARHFLNTKTVPDDFDDARPDLMPVLHMRTYYELLPLRAFFHDGREIGFSYEIVAEHFAVGLSYDMYDSVAMISSRHLDDWEITFYEAMEIAKRNLEEKGCRFGLIEAEESADGPMRLYVMATGDGYDATRLLLTSVFHELELYGDPIALALSTDLLYVVGSEDMAGLSLLLARAESAEQLPHPLAPILLRLVGEQWQPWLPPEEHRLHVAFKRLQLRVLAADYAEQRELWRQLQSDEESEEIVEFLLFDEEGRLGSFCRLRPGKPLLIPKTEAVVFGESLSEQTLVSWGQAVERLGESLRETDDYPQRFRVETLPDSFFAR